LRQQADLLHVSDVGYSALVGCHIQLAIIIHCALAAAAQAVWDSLPEEVESSTETKTVVLRPHH